MDLSSGLEGVSAVGRLLDKGHFVVFDSTQPGIKFSKHITVIIPSPKQSNSHDTANINKEMLFFELLARECVCSKIFLLTSPDTVRKKW